MNINEYKELNTICQTCWGQIWTFLNFQKSVKDAQKRLKEFLAGRANETAYFDELIEVESQTFIVKENLTEAEIRTGNTFKDILAGKNNGHLSATKEPEYIIDGPTLAPTRSQDIKQEVQLVEIIKDPVIKEEEEEVIDVHSDVSQDTWDEEMSSILCYANNRKDNFKNIDKVEEEEEEFINVTDDQNDVHDRKDLSLKGHTSIESVQEGRQLGDGVVILTRNKASPNVKAREVSNTIKRAKLDIKENVCGDVRNSGDNKKLSELTQSDIVIKEEVELIDVHVDSQDTWSEEMTQSSAFTSLEYASNDDSLHNAGDLAQDLAGNFSDNSNEENAAVYILDQSGDDEILVC